MKKMTSDGRTTKRAAHSGVRQNDRREILSGLVEAEDAAEAARFDAQDDASEAADSV